VSGKVTCVFDGKAVLAEGPVWDEKRGGLWWVDIVKGTVNFFDPVTSQSKEYFIGQLIGALVLCQDEKLALALEKGFHRFDPASQSLEFLANPEGNATDLTRFNDGKCDPAGRFFAGVMSKTAESGAGALYSYAGGGEVVKHVDHVSISNGLAWSHDGSIFYYIDTVTQQVVAYDYDIEKGTLSNKRVTIEVPKSDGDPDGMCIDQEGMLWIALWEGWGVARYNPATGEKIDFIDVPVRKVTSCTFGGSKLDTLYITTASVEMKETDWKDQPQAGGIFTCRVGVKGSLPNVFQPKTF
jgi:sugar lactone lactonase YvrE